MSKILSHEDIEASMKDLLMYGTCAAKDGKRVPPEEFSSFFDNLPGINDSEGAKVGPTNS